jgi:hypothetical protein
VFLGWFDEIHVEVHDNIVNDKITLTPGKFLKYENNDRTSICSYQHFFVNNHKKSNNPGLYTAINFTKTA